eukprot:g13230.t1
MRFDEQQGGEAGLGAGAVDTLKCNNIKKDEYEYVGQGQGDERATESNRTVRRTVRRWVQDVHSSLRGRPLFALFTIVNLFNYMDRGVIPGGSEEFNAFIEQTMLTDRPDVFLGILQSGFILGFSIACVIFARLARHRSPFSLMATGLAVWCFAAVSAGMARPSGSYTFLLVARLLSGVGEASFVTVVPPLITETAPPGERGIWLALFYTAQPVGAGIGYVYGSLMATSKLGWPWAFYLEAILMAPLAFACALVPAESATAVPNAADYGTSTAGRRTSTKEYGSQKPLGAGIGIGVGHGESDQSPEPTVSVSASSLASSAASPTRANLRSGRRQLGLDLERWPDGRSARRIERDGEESPLPLPSSASSLLGVWGGEEGRAEGAREDSETSMDWQKHTAEFGNGSGACLVMSPSRVVSRVFDEHEGEEEEEEEEEGRVGWAVGEPAVAAIGSLNSGGPVVAVSSSPFDERARDTAESVLVRDVLKIADRCVFCLVVLGGAATAAVSAGMSTFGTGFVTSLEFLSSETAAAATFGGVICLAGLAGTPAGGALIDAADPEGRLDDDKKLALVLRQATTLMCGATVLLVAATVQSSLIPFLFLFFFGGALLFATSPHANLSIMLASPKHLRPLSIAVNSILLHALGDVPSPTVIGWMKDAYAPHCVTGGGVGAGDGVAGGLRVGAIGGPALDDDIGAVGFGADASWVGAGEEGGAFGVGGISDACRSERRGLHVTLFLTVSWLLWTCLFFSFGRAVQESAMEHGVVPATWGDIRGLIWKGLLRPGWTRRRYYKQRSDFVAPGTRGSSKPSRSWSRLRRWWGQGRGGVRGRPGTLSMNDEEGDEEEEENGYGVRSSLEEALLPSSPTSRRVQGQTPPLAM